MRMAARADEIAAGVIRISTHRPDGLPGGLVYNQFVIMAERPLLVHTGMRTIFPEVLTTVDRVLDPTTVALISGSHASRPDEFGAVNQWLAIAPAAQVAHGKVAVNVCLRHIADRDPIVLADGEGLDAGDRIVRFYATPHVPFWSAPSAGRPLRRRGPARTKIRHARKEVEHAHCCRTHDGRPRCRRMVARTHGSRGRG